MNASSTDGAYRARGARPLTQGYVEDEADTAIFAGHAAASNQAVGIRKLEAVAGRHAEHRSAEKHPGIKLVVRQAERNMIDSLEPGVRSFGVAYGLYNFVWGAGLLSGPAIGGFLFERMGFSRLLIAWAPAIALVTIALARVKSLNSPRREST